MYNPENARRIGNSVGKCIEVEPEHDIQHQNFLRIKIDMDITYPLVVGFWWTNPRGTDK